MWVLHFREPVPAALEVARVNGHDSARRECDENVWPVSDFRQEKRADQQDVGGRLLAQ